MANLALLKAKGSFFDKPAVIKALGKVSANALMHSANSLKRIAQTSMKYVDPIRKNGRPRIVSKPGKPPRAVRTHPLLRQHLYAVYDATTKRAVIGPIKLSALPGRTPAVMEHGGTARIINRRRRVRKVGSVGEIRIGAGAKSVTADKTLLGSVSVAYARLTSADQAARANRINEQLYGPMAGIMKNIAARPFMIPAMHKTQKTMAKKWAKKVKK